MEKEIEIPFGAKDSELKGWEYTIPENMEAEIKDGRIIVKQKESEDERIRKGIVKFINWAVSHGSVRNDWIKKNSPAEWLAYLERQKVIVMHTPRYAPPEQRPVCKYGCSLTDEQLMATDFWKEYLKESIIAGSKPTKQDIDFLLPTARHLFSLAMKESCTVCKDWSNGYQKGLENKRQHPAEWSEEDENKIESIKGLITTGKFVDTNTIRIIWKLLDSLRPQPHWKPSKEQMEDLEYAIGLLGDMGVANTLRELCGDLKKL